MQLVVSISSERRSVFVFFLFLFLLFSGAHPIHRRRHRRIVGECCCCCCCCSSCCCFRVSRRVAGSHYRVFGFSLAKKKNKGKKGFTETVPGPTSTTSSSLFFFVFLFCCSPPPPPPKQRLWPIWRNLRSMWSTSSGRIWHQDRRWSDVHISRCMFGQRRRRRRRDKKRNAFLHANERRHFALRRRRRRRRRRR